MFFVRDYFYYFRCLIGMSVTDYVRQPSVESTKSINDGISLPMTVVFLCGTMAGTGMLALPYAVMSTGKILLRNI